MAWIIDPQHSSIEFTVKHMMISTVRGSFKSYAGRLDLNFDNPAASTVQGTVDTGSVTTGEKDRDNHLRSADFFASEDYPQMIFRSTRIERLGGDQFKVHGDLTIKQTTRPVTFDVAYEGQAKDPWGNRRAGFSATAKLNRKDFGLTWNVALEAGGWLVGEDVKITAEVELIEQVVEKAAEPVAELVAA